MNEDSVLLIDLSSILHPAFHMAAGEPDPNAASTAVIARVRALASGMAYVAVCCDRGRSFRSELDPTYKAQRPDSDARLLHQGTLAEEALAADGFPIWGIKGYEADDLIASACAALGETPVLIATADKDLLALVDERVQIKSLKDGSVLGPAEVKAKIGVDPGQVVEYLMLVGDAADNIRGCKGIGAKRAEDLLGAYGNLSDLYAHLDAHGSDFSPAMATNLREFQGRMDHVRSLVTMRTDAPVPVGELLKGRALPAPSDAWLAEPDPIVEAPEPVQVPLIPEPAPMPAVLAPMMSGAPTTTAATMNPVAVVMGAVAPNFAPKPVQVFEPEPGQKPIPIVVQPAAPKPIPAIDVVPKPAPMQAASAELMVVPGAAAPAPVEWNRQLDPRSMAEAKRLALDLFESRLFSAYGNPPAVLSTILAGREIGLTAMASLRGFHIIEGKPTLSADLIRALVLRSGVAKYFRVVERSASVATWETQRGDDPPVRLTYTIEEAQVAGLLKKGSGWERNPSDMLTARASSKLARLVFPDLVHGFHSPEEF